MTKEEIAKRLNEAVATSRHMMVLRQDGHVDIRDVQTALSHVMSAVIAILAEMEARIAALETWKEQHDHSVEHLP